jgi:hypothetical protein
MIAKGQPTLSYIHIERMYHAEIEVRLYILRWKEESMYLRDCGNMTTGSHS